MSYTKYGEFMRILRIKHHEVMGDLANVLGVSLPFLSAVENGKKNVSDEWINKIKQHYKLNDEEVTELSEAIEHSKTQMKLDLKSAAEFKRTAALQFARSFENMDEETAKKIMELLENSGGDNK
ncbi:MAG: helix-turn-helix transcriptional regulator [Oscillospiraceae bacterium]|nr:helix-turn-helix transcriptional regulator [Oscillospiraceae bacterium]